MSEIVIYEDGDIALNATVDDETICLSQKQMAELFGKSVKTINEYVNNVFKEGELEKELTIRNFRTVKIEGKREAKVVCANFTHTTQHILKSKMYFLHNAFI